MKNFFKAFGPGPMIAAAFIGPGTVTVCSIAGAQYGPVLLWALLFSTLATAVLQESSARLGLVTQRGLAANIKSGIKNKGLRFASLTLVLSAVVVGAIAFESGNIRGGSLGVLALLGAEHSKATDPLTGIAVLCIAVFAALLLWIGRYAVLEKVLVSLVILMSVAFLATAVMVVDSWSLVLRGLFIPQIPEGSIMLVVALIGTTIVPYNLFLHSDIVREKWSSSAHLGEARTDAIVSVGFGGLISMAIVVCAAAVPAGTIQSAGDLAQGLAIVFGDAAKIMMAVGLLAAGLTSAITAPIAATLVLKGVFGWQGDLTSSAQRAVWISVLSIGTGFALLQINAVELIKFAQFANGLVLPFAVAFLLFAVNQKRVLGDYVNSTYQNIMAGTVLIIVTGLGLRAVFKVFKVFS